MIYKILEYNIKNLTIEMTGRKQRRIKIQIMAMTRTFYFFAGFVMLYSKTIKR